MKRGGAVVAQQAHNLKVAGSNPAPATTDDQWIAEIRRRAKAFLARFDESRICPVCCETVVERGERVVREDGIIAWAHDECAVGMKMFDPEEAW